MLLHLSLACLAARDPRIALLADQQLCAVVSVKSGSRRSKCVCDCALQRRIDAAAGRGWQLAARPAPAPALHCTAHAWCPTVQCWPQLGQHLPLQDWANTQPAKVSDTPICRANVRSWSLAAAAARGPRAA